MGSARRQLLVLAAVVIALAAVTAVVWADDGGGSPTPAATAAAGADVFLAKGCAGCHMAAGTDTAFGSPSSGGADGTMPRLNVSPAELQALVAYLLPDEAR